MLAVLEEDHAACLRLSAPATSLLRELAAQRMEAPPEVQQREPQLKAAQAKVNSRVVVVYEEEDEAAGGGAVVQVPYGGVVTKVAAAKGMLVLFEDGESVWVDERAGDEWWYETPPKPPASQADGAADAMAPAVSDEAASSRSVAADPPAPPTTAGTAAAGAGPGWWTSSEDAALRRQVELLGRRWVEVSRQIPGSTAQSCRKRCERLQKAEASRRRQNVPWTVAEENLLARAVEPYLKAGSIDYNIIRSSNFPGRTKVEVKAKWENMCTAQERLTGQKRRR